MSVKVYLEGGGSSSDQKGRKGGRSEQNSRFREGFSKICQKIGIGWKNASVCALRQPTDRIRGTSERRSQRARLHLLLVDAEEPVKSQGPWQHLKDCDNWNRPKDATDDQCHLMVQVMESWFLADTAALKSYFRQGFQEGALPHNPKIEQVPKEDIERKLKQATRNSSKGEYSKGKHSFEILAELDPAKVRQKSPYAERFLSTLEQVCQE